MGPLATSLALALEPSGASFQNKGPSHCHDACDGNASSSNDVEYRIGDTLIYRFVVGFLHQFSFFRGAMFDVDLGFPLCIGDHV